MRFIIYHQAPNGPRMYHRDTVCSLSQDSSRAKIYGNDTTTEVGIKRQLTIVRENFEFVFSTAGKTETSAKLEYKTGEHWMGCGLDKIETKAEIL